MPALEFKSPHTGQAYRVDFENDPSDEDIQKAQGQLSDQEWSASAPLEHNGNELARFLPKPAEGGGLDLTLRIPHYETGKPEYGSLNIPAVTDEDLQTEARKAALDKARFADMAKEANRKAAAVAGLDEGYGGDYGESAFLQKSLDAASRSAALSDPRQARRILLGERAAEALKNSPLADKVGHHGIGAMTNEFIQSVNKLPYDMAATALDALGDKEGRDQVLENFRNLQQQNPGETYPTIGGEVASTYGQFAPVIGMGPLGPLAPGVTMGVQASAGADVRAVEKANVLQSQADQLRQAGDEESAKTLEAQAADVMSMRGPYAATTGAVMAGGGAALPALGEGAGALKAAAHGGATMFGTMAAQGQFIDPTFLGEAERMSAAETLKQSAIGAIIPIVHKGLEAVSKAAPDLPLGTDPAPSSKQALDELARMKAMSQAQNIAQKLSDESMKAAEEERQKKVAEAEAKIAAEPVPPPEELPPADLTQAAPAVTGQAPLPDELTADEHSRYIALLSARQSGVPLDPNSTAELRTLEARNNRAVNASVNQPLPADLTKAAPVPVQPLSAAADLVPVSDGDRADNRKRNDDALFKGLSNYGVHPAVIGSLKDGEVLKSVVSALPVDVMDSLGLGKSATDELRNHPDVFFDRFPIYSEGNAFTKIVKALGDGVTRLRTELLGRLANGDAEGASALFADPVNARFLTGLISDSPVSNSPSGVPDKFSDALARAASRSGFSVPPNVELVAANFARLLDSRHGTQVSDSPEFSKNIIEPSTIQTNAIQKQETGEILQREQEQAGETGGERGRVEPSQQGNEAPNAITPPVEPSGEIQPGTGEQAPHVAPSPPGKVRIAGEGLTESEKEKALSEDEVLNDLKDNSFLSALKGYSIYMPKTIEGRKEFFKKVKGHGEWDWIKSLMDRSTGQYKDPRLKWLEKHVFSDNPDLAETGSGGHIDQVAHDMSGEHPEFFGGESITGDQLGEKFNSEWDAAEKTVEAVRKERSNQSDAEAEAIRKGHEDARKFDAVIAKDGDRVAKVSDLLDEGLDVGHPIELPDGHDAVVTDVDHGRGVVTLDVEKNGESIGTHELKFTDRIPVMEPKELGYTPPADENVPFSRGKGEPAVSSEAAPAVEQVKKAFGGEVPPRVSIIHDPAKRWEARYDKANSRIIVNSAKLPLDEVVNKVNHEIGHHVWTDPKVRKAFKTLWDGLSGDQRASIEKHVKEAYKGDRLDVRFEEKRVRALEEVLKSSKDRSLWQKLVAAVKSAWARVTGRYPKDPQDAAHAILREGLRRLGKVQERAAGERFSKSESDTEYHSALKGDKGDDPLVGGKPVEVDLKEQIRKGIENQGDQIYGFAKDLKRKTKWKPSGERIRFDASTHEGRVVYSMTNLDDGFDGATNKSFDSQEQFIAAIKRYEKAQETKTTQAQHDTGGTGANRETLASVKDQVVSALSSGGSMFSWREGGKDTINLTKDGELLALFKPYQIRKLVDAGVIYTKQNNAQGTDYFLPEFQSPKSPATSDAAWLARNPKSAEKLQRIVEQRAKEAGYDTTPLYHGRPEGSPDWAGAGLNPHEFERSDWGYSGPGIYFTQDPKIAGSHYSSGGKGTVFKLYAKMQKPFGDGVLSKSDAEIINEHFRRDYGAVKDVAKEGMTHQRLVDKLGEETVGNNLEDIIRPAGYDGVFVKGGTIGDEMEGVVYDPSQIKSADPITRDDSGRVIPIEERFKSESPDIRYSKSDVSGESEDRRTFEQAPKLAEKPSEPTKSGVPITADKLASMLPYGLAGNKASLVTKGGLGRILSDLAGGAKRVLDVFGGAGTYTQYLSAIGNLPKGSKLNEWEWHRALTQKWIKENPEAVISEVQSLKKELGAVLDSVPKKLGLFNDSKGKQEAYLRWVNNKLQELVNPDKALQESEWKNFSRVPLIDDPRSAAFNYVVQELRFGNAPVEVSRAPVGELLGESGLGRPMMAEGADAKTGEPAPLSSARIIGKIGDKVEWPGRLADVADTVKRASSGLKDVEVLGPWSPDKGDAWEIARNAGAGDVVPLDPPYIGAQNYGKGTSWMKDAKAFTDKLLEVTKDARERGAVFVLTNNWNSLLAKELAKAGWSSLGGKRGSGDREIISISDPGLVKSSYVSGGGVRGLANGPEGQGATGGEGLRLQAGEPSKAKRVATGSGGGAGAPAGGEGGGEGSDVRPGGETEAGSGAETERVDRTPKELPKGGPLDAYKSEEERNAETAKLAAEGASPDAIRFHQQFGEARGSAYVEQATKPMRDFARALKGEPASDESLNGPPSEEAIAVDKDLAQRLQDPAEVEGLRQQFQEWWQAQGGENSKFHTGDAVHMIIQNELMDDAVRLAATGDMSLAQMLSPGANDILALTSVAGAGRILQARGMSTSSPFWKSVQEASGSLKKLAEKDAGVNLTRAEKISKQEKITRENDALKRILAHQTAKTAEASLTAVKSLEEAQRLRKQLSGAEGAEAAAGEVVDRVANPEGLDDSVIDKAVQGMSEEMKADVTAWWESLQRRAAILDMLQEKEGRLSLPSKAEAMKADLVGLTPAELRAELAKEDAKIAGFSKKMAVRAAPAKDLLGGKAPAEGEAKAPIDLVSLGIKTQFADFARAVTPKKGKKVDAQREVFSALMRGLRGKFGDAVPKEAKTPEDQALALGLLILHQADAREILERLKQELYSQEATKGFTVKGGALEAAVQASIGRRLDDPDKPYGRAQVRSVLAAEMGNVKATVGQLARDNVLMGKTWSDLEASLRDPKRGLEERLGKPAFDELLGAVQEEYEGKISEQRLKNLKADEKAAVAKAQAEAARADRKATDTEIRDAIDRVREQRAREATVERSEAAQNRTETREAIKEAQDLVKEQRARREAVERPERDAQDILDDLADTSPKAPPISKPADVRRTVNREISTDKPLPEADLRQKLADLGVQPESVDKLVEAIGKERDARAQTVADAKETREAIAEAKAKVRRDTAPVREARRLIDAAVEGKGLKALSDMIADAPAYLQNDPKWRRQAIEEWFRRKGSSPEMAKSKAEWFSSKIDDVIRTAKDKAFMDVANRDFANNKNGEKSLELLRKAIRVGVTDPSINMAEAVATEHGYKGFSPEQHKEMADLDIKLRDPNMGPHNALKYRDRLSEIVAEASLPPEAHKILTDWFMSNILGGLGTAQLHFHGYAFQMAKQFLSELPQAAAMGPAGIKLWANEIIRTLKSAPFISPAFWRKFGWSVLNGLHYGADDGEVLPHQSELAKVHLRAMKVLEDPNSSPVKKAASVVKIFLAANRLSMHLLGGLNAYLHDTVEAHHTYFNGAQVAKRFGVKTGRVNDMIRESMEKGDQFREQGEAMGLSGNDLYMHVEDAMRKSFVDSLQAAGVDVSDVKKAAKNEAVAVTGMTSFEGGGKMKDEEGKMMKDQPVRAVPRFMQWLQDLTNEKPGAKQFLSPLRIAAKSAFPVLKQPFNALYGEGGFYVPGWGAIRFLKDAGYREGATTLLGRTGDYLRSPYLLARNLALGKAATTGQTLYSRSLATPEMYASRMIGNVISTAVLGGLYAVLKKNDDMPDDQKYFRVNGMPPQDKARLAAWRADDRAPESIQFRVPGSDKWFGLKMPEQLTPAIMALSAFRDAEKTGHGPVAAGAGAILQAALNSVSPIRDMMRRGEGFSAGNETALEHQLSSSAQWAASRGIPSYLVPFKALLSSIDDAVVKPSDMGKADTRNQPLLTQTLLQVPFIQSFKLFGTDKVPTMVNMFGDPVGVGPNFEGIIPTAKAGARFRLPLFVSTSGDPDKKALYELMLDRQMAPSLPPSMKALGKSLKRTSYEGEPLMSGDEYADYLKARGDHLFNALSRYGVDRLRELDDEGLRKKFREAASEASDRAKRVVR